MSNSMVIVFQPHDRKTYSELTSPIDNPLNRWLISRQIDVPQLRIPMPEAILVRNP